MESQTMNSWNDILWQIVERILTILLGSLVTLFAFSKCIKLGIIIGNVYIFKRSPINKFNTEKAKMKNKQKYANDIACSSKDKQAPSLLKAAAIKGKQRKAQNGIVKQSRNEEIESKSSTTDTSESSTEISSSSPYLISTDCEKSICKSKDKGPRKVKPVSENGYFDTRNEESDHATEDRSSSSKKSVCRKKERRRNAVGEGNEKKRKNRQDETKGSKDLQKGEAFLMPKKQLQLRLSSGSCGDLSCSAASIDDTERKQKARKCSKHKGRNSVDGSGITSPRIPTITVEKISRDKVEVVVDDKGGQIKLPFARIFFPPGCLKSRTTLCLAVCGKQKTRRDDRISGVVFLTPALHLWMKNGSFRTDQLHFETPVHVSLAQDKISSSIAPTGVDVKVHRTEDIMNLEWLYFDDAKVDIGRFIGFQIRQLGGYRVITSNNTESFIELNYVLCVMRSVDPARHNFFAKIYTTNVQKSVHAEMNAFQNYELVIQEQMVSVKPGSTLTISISGEGLSTSQREHQIPRDVRSIKRAFQFDLLKTDGKSILSNESVRLLLSVSSPFTPTQNSGCNFQWVKKCQPNIAKQDFHFYDKVNGVTIIGSTKVLDNS